MNKKDYEVKRQWLLRHLLNHGFWFGEGGAGNTWLADFREGLQKENGMLIAAELIWHKIKKYNPDVLYGHGFGAAGLCAAVQVIASQEGRTVSVLLGRDERKDRNRKRIVEGPRPVPGHKAVIIDDIFNTGRTNDKIKEVLVEDNIRLSVVAHCCILDMWSNGGRGGMRRLRSQGKVIEYIFTRHDFGFTRIDAKQSCLEKLLWRNLVRNNGNYNRKKAPPLIYRDKIIYITDQGTVFCHNAHTGDTIWKYQGQTPATSHIWREVGSFPIAHEDNLYYTSYDGTVRCLNINTGELVWHRMISTFIHSTPELCPDLDCMLINSELHTLSHKGLSNDNSDISCIKMSTGDLIWRSDIIRATGPGSCSRNGNKFVVGSNNNSLVCRNLQNGDKLWEVPFPDNIKGKPAWLDNFVYAVCEQGYLKIIDADSGTVVKDIRIGKTAHHQFITAIPEKQMIVVASGELIHGYSKDGDRLWLSRARGNIDTGGILVNNYFLTITRGGYISITNITDGSKVAWDWIKDMNSIMAVPAWNGELLAINTTKRGLFVYRTDLL